MRARSANEGSGTAGWPLVVPLACFPKVEEDIGNHCPLRCRGGEDYACAFFWAIQRAFTKADKFFLAAVLIIGRVLVLAGAAPFGADFPFHLARRCFIATEIRLRAAALIVRPLPADVALGGLSRLGADVVSPSRAEMAWSRRLRSVLNSATRFWTSIEFLACPAGTAHCSSQILANFGRVQV